MRAELLADTAAEAATRRQGGDIGVSDPNAAGWLECGTCVVPGGPHPAALAALGALTAGDLRAHPFTVIKDMLGDDEIPGPYTRWLGVPAAELVPIAGISQGLTIVQAIYPDAVTIGPDYTETIQRFTVWPGELSDTPAARADRIQQAMAANRGSAVVFSSPANPTGTPIPCEWLGQIAAEHPNTLMVVDEAYAEFQAVPDTMLRYPRDNILVLRSPNKPIGMAGIRIGVAWSPNPAVREQIRRRVHNWPWSRPDGAAATAAMKQPAWITEAIAEAVLVAAAMHQELADMFGKAAVPPSPTHFRLLWMPNTGLRDALWGHLAAEQIDVRLLADDQPGRVSGLRIAAPTPGDWPRLREGLRSFPRGRW